MTSKSLRPQTLLYKNINSQYPDNYCTVKSITKSQTNLCVFQTPQWEAFTCDFLIISYTSPTVAIILNFCKNPNGFLVGASVETYK